MNLHPNSYYGMLNIFAMSYKYKYLFIHVQTHRACELIAIIMVLKQIKSFLTQMHRCYIHVCIPWSTNQDTWIIHFQSLEKPSPDNNNHSIGFRSVHCASLSNPTIFFSLFGLLPEFISSSILQ